MPRKEPFAKVDGRIGQIAWVGHLPTQARILGGETRELATVGKIAAYVCRKCLLAGSAGLSRFPSGVTRKLLPVSPHQGWAIVKILECSAANSRVFKVTPGPTTSNKVGMPATIPRPRWKKKCGTDLIPVLRLSCRGAWGKDRNFDMRDFQDVGFDLARTTPDNSVDPLRHEMEVTPVKCVIRRPWIRSTF